ncbi:AraC family transcriptional regulator [Paenibacillus chartarius]|uniref:AraC family transcriptional regulator n=1 Tax=Paenibacillus chartarius TaxID=747481 RepID=A0ABV6DMY8_9BACL
MFRLMIADDERLEREGLEWIITHMMPDTFRLLHASSGRMAIELADEHRPHIIIMDIQMPGIHGLEAIREIKQRLPEAKFVLVSAYDDFAYAQEAISLGVKAYIVKPAGREQIVSTLQQLIDELEQEKRKRREELELRDRLSQLSPLAENELAFMLMTDQIREADRDQLSEWLEFPLDYGCALVVAFPESMEAIEALNKQKIYDRIKSYARTGPLPSIVSPFLDRHAAIFVRKPSGMNGEQWQEELKRYAEKLAGTMKRQLDNTAFIGVGSSHSEAEGLRRSYFEAVFASTCYGPDRTICYFDELRNGTSPLPVLTDQRNGSFDDRARQTYVMAALERIRDEREKQTVTVLDKAVQYIKERYTEELSLEEVAGFVHLHPHYFSKVFKQQVGETFIDYLTGLRIEKAKQLMNTSMSLKEVCFEVGYKDPNYFSRVFKKVTGVSPSEYRVREHSE